MKFLFAMAAFAAVMTSAYAADEQTPALGPPVGAQIPHDLSAPADDGTEQDFQSLAGEKGVALFFVRSVDWCPYCQAQVIDVSARQAEFAERGLNVVFLSYDSPETQATFKSRKDVAARFLSDGDVEIINAFGLLNDSMKKDSRYYGAPHPAVFIVNNDRAIAAKLYEEDYLTNAKSYRERPPVDVILGAVDDAVEAGRL